jgi:hypothetical protein
MLEHEDRKEIAKLNYIKTWSSFAVAAIWIGAIGTLVWIISLTLSYCSQSLDTNVILNL